MKLSDIWAVPSIKSTDGLSMLHLFNHPVNMASIPMFDIEDFCEESSPYGEYSIIKFGGGEVIWYYRKKEDRDKDYQMLMDKIT